MSQTGFLCSHRVYSQRKHPVTHFSRHITQQITGLVFCEAKPFLVRVLVKGSVSGLTGQITSSVLNAQFLGC